MKRLILVVGTLALLGLHSFGPEKPEPGCSLPAAYGMADTPRSACRYKKPFPFHNVVFVKKRLSTPPVSENAAAFCLQRHLAPAPRSVPVCLIPSPAVVLPEEMLAVDCAFHASRWHNCEVAQHVFHPPPNA